MKKIVEEEYYHVYNRGVDKRDIFIAEKDYWRFITSVLLLQGSIPVPQISRYVKDIQHRRLNKDIFNNIVKNKLVELVCFCLMPNHFHIIVKELERGGISKFMQRVGNSYTKYFNTKYDRTGHLFGGSFKSIHIDINNYLLYLSSYIHLNSRDLKKWQKKEDRYPWSSLQDFLFDNRWGEFLNPSIVIDQFSNLEEYKNFLGEFNIEQGAHLLDLGDPK